MRDTPPHLKPLEEIEETGIPGLVRVLREEARRCPLRPLGRYRAAQGLLSSRLEKQSHPEQKRKGWEMAVRIEKILCTVLHEAHERQVEETTETLSEGPDGFYRSASD